MTQVLLLVAVLGAATAFGLWRRHTDGRMRTVAHAEIGDVGRDPGDVRPTARGSATPPEIPADDVSEPLVVDGGALGPADHSIVPAANVLAAADLGEALGHRATLVQFSSAFCQPCRVTRVVLGDVARAVPGVVHVEIDAESHLDLVRRVDVTRTPTVLVLDSEGRIRTRATGAPRTTDVLAALDSIL